ncbi:hypothetical protein M3Y99_00823400 [Aphelenchoides fujianensis]|nr:hypothetical protein M3Y99_00823400 [Aphelenchoides fujianensis]
MTERPSILRLLHRFQRPTSVCLALDNGGRVVLGKTRTIAVLRLDVAEAAVKVEQTTQFPFGYFVCLAWSGDGRQLYAMDANYLKEVHVYPLEEREWDVEMVSGNGLDLSTIQPLSCSSSHTFYAHPDSSRGGVVVGFPAFVVLERPLVA